jgi:hypothetical protein
MNSHWYISEIVTAIDSSSTADAAMLTDAAIAYADACHVANERLSQIAGILHRGLRTEAIELAEESPPLLEYVAELDFPRRGEWAKLLSSLQMETPPELAVARAAELNQAYTEAADLESLLRKHRLLAIGRAPLLARLKLLRMLRQKDPENLVWQESIEAYEEARHGELKRELANAARSGSAEHAAVIYNELDKSPWIKKPSDELYQRAYDLRAGRIKEAALEELELLALEIDSAYSELDEEKIVTLADSWRQTAINAELDPRDTLAERVAPALEWNDERRIAHEQEAAFWTDVAFLEAETDREGPTQDKRLRHALRNAKRHEFELPELVRQRAEDRLTAISRQQKRRTAAIAIVSSLAATFLITAGGLAWWSSSYQATVEKHDAALTNMLENKDIVAEVRRSIKTSNS